MRKKTKRIYGILLSTSMLLTLLSVPVWAAEPIETGTGYEQEQKQIQEQGQTQEQKQIQEQGQTQEQMQTQGQEEGQTQAPEHEHTQGCYTLTENCVHEHTLECYPQTTGTGTVSGNNITETVETQPTACTHVCSEENGCITKEWNCGYNTENNETPAAVGTTQGTGTAKAAEQETETVTVESVQAMIDALPDAEEISTNNAEEVAEQLEAIDKAKTKLSDEEIDTLDFTGYMKAAAALGELSVPMLTANGIGEVSAENELTTALADGSIPKITLIGNIDISNTLVINRAVTLDLNGCVLKMAGSGSVIQIKSGGSLIIEDNNASSPHKFTPDSNGLWVLDNNGTETVSGGVITGGTGTSHSSWFEGGGVYIEAQGRLVMNGGSIVGCSAGRGYGGGVFLKGKNAQFTMNGDAAILGCISESGAGVCVDVDGAFTMNAGKIENCLSKEAGERGGGVWLWEKASFRMNGGEIKNCKLTGTSSRGGGVAVERECSFVMMGGSISGCEAWSGGGVFISNSGTFLMGGNACISDCQADKRANGVDSNSEFNFTICDNAFIKGSVKNEGILNADGGSIEGDVNNNSEYAKITGTGAGSTEFKNGTVTNTGIIEKGVFSSNVTNGVDSDGTGTINGGIFKGSVVNQEGALIYGGDFTQAGLTGYLAITFDPNNGGGQSTQKVDLSGNRKLTEPDPSPVKQDRTMAGWYYTKNGVETKWDFINDTVQYTMTLKAGWGYQIDAAANPATGGKVDGVGVHIENTSVTLNSKANFGYRFVKWTEGGIEVSNDVNYTFIAMSNRNLVAVFEKEKQTPTAPETEAAGGSHAQDNSGSNSYIADSETGESTGSGSTALVIYPTLTFDTCGGSSIKQVRAFEGHTIYLSGYLPTREGYQFSGWYADQNLTQPVTEIRLNGNRTVYAGWIKQAEQAGESSKPKAAPAQLIVNDNEKTANKDSSQPLIEDYEPGSTDTPEDQITEDQSPEDTGDNQKPAVDNSPADNDSEPDDSADLAPENNSHSGGWIPVVCICAGALVIGSGLHLGFRKWKKTDRK